MQIAAQPPSPSERPDRHQGVAAPASRRRFLGAASGAGLLLVGCASTRRSSAMDDPEQRALHALQRLGYGPSPADVQALRSQGARRWLESFLHQQLHPAEQPLPDAAAQRLQALDLLSLNQGALYALYLADASTRRESTRNLLQQAAQARLVRAVESQAMLQEVLVDFWFNHFNVFSGKGPVGIHVANYEREAIRPHVLGRFRDLLGATARHPAMLLYLDNALSTREGLAPQATGNRVRGLNENYARELMELHTLGVDGGYNQRDVTELARIFTGWTVDGQSAARGRLPTAFTFAARRHDDGIKHWLGREVRPAGQAEGEQALDVLASHPATARHVATKLARRFVADVPPAGLVEQLALRFQRTDGDLRAVMQTLVESDALWSSAAWRSKFKTPWQYQVSSLRALGQGTPADVRPVLGALAQAGMPLFGCPTPDGYADTTEAWRNPEALAQRLQWAQTVTSRVGPSSAALLQNLQPLWSDGTRNTVVQSSGAQQAALLLSSPDFLRC